MKKLLNSAQILLGSVVNFPLMFISISLISFLFYLPVNLFMLFQIFLLFPFALSMIFTKKFALVFRIV